MACRITDYMKPEWVAPDLKAKDKQAVLFELASLVNQSDIPLNPRDVHAKLLEREQKASTGADHGVAIPHATIESADTLIVLFGKSSRGIPFNALDNEDSNLFFAVLSPTERRPSEVSYLQLISSICRLMRSAVLRERLRGATTAQEVIDLLRKEEDQKFGQPLSASP